MTSRDGQAYERFSAAVDPLMMVLALAMIPLLVVPLVHPLHGAAETGFATADWFIWALFVGEYVIKFYLAPVRRQFVRTHVIDLAVIVLPMLRPLRVLRLLRLGTIAARGLRDGRAILGRRGVRYTALVAVVVVFASAGAETALERNASGATIHGFGDALWWAVTTVTTVGYGDKVPVTAAGRGVAIVLMLTGIAIFGAVTASIAAFFVETGEPTNLDDIAARLERIEAILAGIATSDGVVQRDSRDASVDAR